MAENTSKQDAATLATLRAYAMEDHWIDGLGDSLATIESSESREVRTVAKILGNMLEEAAEQREINKALLGILSRSLERLPDLRDELLTAFKAAQS